MGALGRATGPQPGASCPLNVHLTCKLCSLLDSFVVEVRDLPPPLDPNRSLPKVPLPSEKNPLEFVL